MRLGPIIRIFAIVTGGALLGMAMGGIFGHYAAVRAPEFVLRSLRFPENTSIPAVTAGEVTGMAYGVILGGVLAAFAIAVAAFHRFIDSREQR